MRTRRTSVPCCATYRAPDRQVPREMYRRGHQLVGRRVGDIGTVLPPPSRRFGRPGGAPAQRAGSSLSGEQLLNESLRHPRVTRPGCGDAFIEGVVEGRPLGVVEPSSLSSTAASTGRKYTTSPSGKSVGSSRTRRPLWTWALSGCIIIEVYVFPAPVGHGVFFPGLVAEGDEKLLGLDGGLLRASAEADGGLPEPSRRMRPPGRPPAAFRC